MTCNSKPSLPPLPGRFTARLLAAGLLLALGAALPVHAETGDTLSTIRARGVLRCGVSQGVTGFSTQGQDGQWHGLDVDFCRAMAAAALGDPHKVKFIPLSAPQRFPALQTQSIDILARNTTWTVAREANFSVIFVGVTYYDSEGLLVRATLPGAAGDSLDGLRVCVETGTDQLDSITAYARTKNWHITPVIVADLAELRQKLDGGACDAAVDDISGLHDLLSTLPRPGDYKILPDKIAKEPLGPLVRWDDGQWIVLARAVYAALIDADERGLTQAQAQAMLAGGTLTQQETDYLADTNQIGIALALASNWAVQVIAATGNYGEMFDRNLGAGSALKLDPGPNRPWTEGGLLYAPPLQ
jgi:general L-amino acid transport system substrate-binding protein